MGGFGVECAVMVMKAEQEGNGYLMSGFSDFSLGCM